MLDLLFDALSKIPNLVVVVLAFFTVFIVHELGHYFAAKLCAMKIEHFAVGYGRRLWYCKDRSGTEWSFHLFPVGGHVLISSLSFEEHSAVARALWQRTLVVLAGPLANMLLPFLILPMCFMITGYPIILPAISAVESGSPAAIAGLKQNDIIRQINGRDIISYEDVANTINDSKGAPLTFEILREGKSLRINTQAGHDVYTDVVGIARDRYRVGILNGSIGFGFSSVVSVDGLQTKDDPDQVRQLVKDRLGRPVILGLELADNRTHIYNVTLPPEMNAHLDDPDDWAYDIFFLGPVKDNRFIKLPHQQAILYGLYESASLLDHLIRVPFQIFPLDPEIFGEQITFLKDTEYYTHWLIYRYAYLVAIISFIIGFVNLLPLPRLDGDYLVAYMLEGIKKRKALRKERAIVMGVTLFMIYSVMLLYNLGDFPQYVAYKIEKMQFHLEDWTEPE